MKGTTIDDYDENGVITTEALAAVTQLTGQYLHKETDCTPMDHIEYPATTNKINIKNFLLNTSSPHSSLFYIAIMIILAASLSPSLPPFLPPSLSPSPPPSQLSYLSLLANQLTICLQGCNGKQQLMAKGTKINK